MEYAFDNRTDSGVSESYSNSQTLHSRGPDDVFAYDANLDLLLDHLLEQPGLIPNSDYAAQHWQDARNQSSGLNSGLSVGPIASCEDSYASSGGCSTETRWNECSFEDVWPQVSPSGAATEIPYAASAYGLNTGTASASNAIPVPKSDKGKKYKRLSTEAVRILKSWLYRHQNYPYPTDEEKIEFEQRTGLDRTQISNWFINARRRKRLGVAPSGVSRQSQSQDSSLTPLERWQKSPPESEAAMPFDILRALEDAQSPAGSAMHNSEKDLSSTGSTCADSAFYTTSASSLDLSQSSTSELSIALPQRQHIPRPPTPIVHAGPRRRRRKVPKFVEKRKVIKRLFQCTFCADSFATRYDWQRHEKALHLAVDQWICAPQGGIIEVHGVNTCAFCQEQGVDHQHLEGHNYSTCRDKSPEQRSFPRKDHLRQHLKLTHNVAYHPSMDVWRDIKTRLISRCGFCNTSFTTWEERVDHLAGHFKDGADMIQWKGDWGFDPSVQGMVENAIPPYLLGQEQTTPDPWKISELVGDEEGLSAGTNVPNGLDRYVNLRRDILAYLDKQMAQGLHPSDEMIQDEARRVAYGTEDRWNLTYADDQVWLDVIKSEAGLGLSRPQATQCGGIEEVLQDAMERFLQPFPS